MDEHRPAREETNEPRENIKRYVPEPGNLWLESCRQCVKESLGSIESAARQFITVNGVLIGIYFHAVVYTSTLRHRLAMIVPAFLFLLPLILWLMSLVVSMLVICPAMRELRLTSERDAERSFRRIVAYKYRYYQLAACLMTAGILVLVYLLGMYLYFVL